MKVYLATPISGIPQMNLPACQRAKEVLESLGHQVFLPHNIEPFPHEGPCPYAPEYPGITGQKHNGYCYLRADIAFMLRYCDAVVMMPGWERSRGALAERRAALGVRMPVHYYLSDDDPLTQEPW